MGERSNKKNKCVSEQVLCVWVYIYLGESENREREEFEAVLIFLL